jgi:hypothetical protein
MGKNRCATQELILIEEYLKLAALPSFFTFQKP